MHKYFAVELIDDALAVVTATVDTPTAGSTINGTAATVTTSAGSWGLISAPAKLVLVVLLSLLIIGIVVGNSLVILSVTVFSKMRTLSNCLIGSLASADLLVAIFVLPISLQHEVTGRWTLGLLVCELWITMDVFCCTASILNIVVIAVDRYWLITRNLSYTHSAWLPRRTVCGLLLTGAWLVSALIASSPLLGWRAGTERDDPAVCLISQDYAYTVFSTFGAFWFPLAVILIVYAKIFRFARLRARRRNGGRAPVTTTPTNNRSRTDVKSAAASAVEVEELTKKTPKKKKKKKKKTQMAAGNEDRTTMLRRTLALPPPPPAVCCVRPDGNRSRPGLTETTVAVDMRRKSLLRPALTSIPVAAAAATSTAVPDTPPPSPIESSSATRSPAAVGNNNAASTPARQHLLPAYDVTATAADGTTASAAARGGGGGGSANRKCRARRMRRSARTLGLVIGGFVICWMPFFVIATIAPFCPQCDVPDEIKSLVLWLGYSNSLFNPAIYAIWDQSFRRSFKRICTCDRLR